MSSDFSVSDTRKERLVGAVALGAQGLQIHFDGDVRTELLERADMKVRKIRDRGGKKGHARISSKLGGIEEHQLVNSSGRKRGAVEPRARLKQHAKNLAAAQFLHHNGKINLPKAGFR